MDRVQLVTAKQLQEIYKLVERTNSWDAINWNKYPTVPGDGQNMVKIRNRPGVSKYLFEAQRTGSDSSECDTHILCDDGFVPCHRIVLMEFSPVLKELIIENMKQIGIPTQHNIISIAMKDFKLQNMLEVLIMFYTGFSIFPAENLRTVIALLEFLKVKNDALPQIPTADELKKKKSLKRFEDISDIESDADDEKKTAPSRTSEWVQTLPGGSNSTVAVAARSAKKHNFKAEKADKQIEEQVFVKVPPGSLTRKPFPRIQRSDENAAKKFPSKTAPKMLEKEPIASTSKAAQEMEHESQIIDGHVSDYNPESSSSSSDNLSNKAISDQSDFEEEEVPIRPNLRDRSMLRCPAINYEEITTSLAERVKTKSRYPQRSRKETERRMSLDSVESQEELEQGTPIERESTKAADNDIAPPKRRKKKNRRFRCFFCRTLFGSELELLHHSGETCGKHLNGKFDFENRICLICRGDFSAYSHYGLIKHVQNCYMDGAPSDSRKGSEHNDDEYSDIYDYSDSVNSVTNLVRTEDRRERQIEDDDSIYGDEKFRVGDPSVVVEKLSDERIKRIIATVNQGRNVVIPRPRGYNYVKVTPKSEIPDLFPDETPEEIMARLRVLEKEQEDYQRDHDLRQRLKLKAAQRKLDPPLVVQSKVDTPLVFSSQMDTPLVVPPLILNRSRLLGEKEIEANARDIFKKLTVCSCEKSFLTLSEATKCLSSHGHKRCWICCELLSLKTPLENHYRTCHYEITGSPGEVTCPICKVPNKYIVLGKHMSTRHLNHLIGLGPAPEAVLLSAEEVVNAAHLNSTTAELQIPFSTSYIENDDVVGGPVGSNKKSTKESKNGKKAEKRLKKLNKSIPEPNTTAEGQELQDHTNKIKEIQAKKVGRKRSGAKSASVVACKKKKLSDNNVDIGDVVHSVLAVDKNLSEHDDIEIPLIDTASKNITLNTPQEINIPEKNAIIVQSNSITENNGVSVSATNNINILESEAKAKAELAKMRNSLNICRGYANSINAHLKGKPAPRSQQVFNAEKKSKQVTETESVQLARSSKDTSFPGITLSQGFTSTTSTEFSSNPEVTESSRVTSCPNITSNPVVTGSPGVTSSPNITSNPEVTASTGVTLSPNITSNPEVTASPGVTSSPNITPNPEVTLSQNVINEFNNTPTVEVNITQPQPPWGNALPSSLTTIQPPIDSESNLLKTVDQSTGGNALLTSTQTQLVTQNLSLATWVEPRQDPCLPLSSTACPVIIEPNSVPLAQVLQDSNNERALVPAYPVYSSDNHLTQQTGESERSLVLMHNPTSSSQAVVVTTQPQIQSAVLSSDLQRRLNHMSNSQRTGAMYGNGVGVREYCGETIVNGQSFTVYRRSHCTTPHPDTIVSLAGAEDNVPRLSASSPKEITYPPSAPIRAILPADTNFANQSNPNESFGQPTGSQFHGRYITAVPSRQNFFPPIPNLRSEISQGPIANTPLRASHISTSSVQPPVYQPPTLNLRPQGDQGPTPNSQAGTSQPPTLNGQQLDIPNLQLQLLQSNQAFTPNHQQRRGNVSNRSIGPDVKPILRPGPNGQLIAVSANSLNVKVCPFCDRHFSSDSVFQSHIC